MSMFAEQPFNENEERYFLAEILKKSNLPPTLLLDLIHNSQIVPEWTEIALPNGRSVASCQNAFNRLLGQLHPPVQQQQQQQQQQQYRDPRTLPQGPLQRQLKRPISMIAGDLASVTARELQPRPPTFSGYGASPALISPVTLGPIEPPRKKRGRPTKAEHELRAAEAHAKGEIWPKPRNKKPRRSSEAAAMDTSIGHGSPMDESGGERSSTGPPQRLIQDSNGSMPPSLASPTRPSHLSGHLSPLTPRGSIQDILQPAGQAKSEETREDSSARTPGANTPYYRHQPSRPQSGSGGETDPPRTQPYETKMDHTYHPPGN